MDFFPESVVKSKLVLSEQHEEVPFPSGCEEEEEEEEEEDTERSRSTGLRWSLIASLSAEHSGVSPLLVSAEIAEKVLTTADVYTSTGTGKRWMCFPLPLHYIQLVQSTAEEDTSGDEIPERPERKM